MGTITENFAAVEKRIETACARAGREPGSVRLLPITKTKPPEALLEGFAAGYHRFGENKVQEAWGKYQVLADVEGLEWAIVGHLQTNKARFVARFASEFQALDSLRVAKELDKRLHTEGRQLDVLVQVNSSGEDSKYGLPPDEVLPFARQLGAFDALRVRGLMTLAVLSDDQEAVGACFARMAELRRRLQSEAVLDLGWEELSMGMSGDFELAIEHGATCVRVGQAIFGNRLDPNDYWPGIAPS